MYGSWVRVPARSQINDYVAQLVEHPDFYREGPGVLGSSPSQSRASSKTEFFFMPFAYIIYSPKLNKYYIGACTDLERRLYEHSIGHSKFTCTGIPWILKRTEIFHTLQEAKKRESTIKKMKSGKYIESLFS